MKNNQRLKIKKVSKLLVSALMLGGLSIVPSAMAADVTTWSEYQTAVNGSDATINVNNNITYEGTTNYIARTLSIIGNATDRYLSGNNAYRGLIIGEGGNLLKLENITMQNFKNTSTVGGAIENRGTINSITGDFIGNTTNTAYNGGAIANTGIINSITGNFKDNSAKNGGAVSNSKDKEINFVAENGKNIRFDGNYVTSNTGNGGAIYNFQGTVGLYAKTINDTITFVGGEDDTTNNKYDIDGIFNIGTLNINGDGTNTYSGTVNLYNVSNNSYPVGITNIYGGTVSAKYDITQENLNIKDNVTFDLAKNQINKVNVTNLSIADGVKLRFDVNGSENDKFIATNIATTANDNGIIIDSINMMSDFNGDSIILFDSSNITLLGGKIAGTYTYYNGNLYEFTQDSTDGNYGKLNVSKTASNWTIQQVIAADTYFPETDPRLPENLKIINTYSMAGDENLISDLGELTRYSEDTPRTLTINGNGHTLNGKADGYDAVAGITVNSGDTLILNNISMQNFQRDAYGGAIYNNSHVGDITGDFINNSATSTEDYAHGGAIYNFYGGTIGDITGDFINNSATSTESYAYGGAIYNEDGEIGDITGDFISNNITSKRDAHGGAIYNYQGEIGNITGDFINNSATSTERNVFGGAIYNYQGEIGNITGDFINNSATSTEDDAYGGAIYNSDSEIGNITGNFENNSANSTNKSAYGGAIYNTGNIKNITAEFISNTVNNGSGGAIYNEGSIGTSTADGIVNSNFTANSASSGGAIYNKGTVYINDSTFTENTSQNSGGAIYNAATSENVGILNIKDSTFTENSARGVGGAIYNQQNGILNLSGTNEFSGNEMRTTASSFTPNDIYNDGTMNINDGLTVISSGIDGLSNSKTYIKNGATLALGVDTAVVNWGEAGTGITINQGTLNMANGAILDMRNKNPYDIVSLTEFIVETGNSTINIDADLSINQTDQIIVSSMAEGNIKLGSVNVMKDANTGGSFNLFTGSNIDTTITGLTTATSLKTYEFTGDDTVKGVVNYNIIGNGYKLPEVIQANTGTAVINSYSLTEDQNLEKELGILTSYNANPRDLVVFGNGNTVFGNNHGGVTVGNGNSLLLDDITMEDFKDDIAMTIESGGIVDIDNYSNIDGNIENAGTLNIQDSVIGLIEEDEETDRIVKITGNIKNTGTLDIEDSLIFGSIKDNDTPTGIINTQGDVTILGGSTDSSELIAAKANEININDGTLTVAGDTDFKNTNIDNANLNLQSIVNGIPTEVNANLGNLTLKSDTTFSMDGNLKEMTMSTVQVTSANLNNNTINLDVKYSGIGTNTNFTLDPFADEPTRSALKDAINYQGQSLTTPIFKYATQYDQTNGLIQVGVPYAGGANSYDNYNPSVFAGSVAAQMGGYLNLIQTYENAFEHMDTYMLMTSRERLAMKMRNSYAAAGVGSNLMTYSPNQTPEAQRGMWVKPFASFEKVNLNRGPRVENIGYGTFLGGDSDLIELKHGWDAVFSGHVSYNGSHQNYDGVSVYQNGGTLGGTATFYKDNFFTGLTANVGASVAEASTMYGQDNMTMLLAGIASKTGYNWELAKGKFIVQPSMLISYSFVNTFDFKNSAGVNIHSNPLNAIQVAPGLKFIGNLPNGWQPYIGLQMVWNIIDESKVKANDVWLPETSVDPYFQYGVGVQKRWGERFTGFFQTMLRNGGRTGVALSAGFRWAIGDKPSEKSIKASTPELPKTKVELQSVK